MASSVAFLIRESSSHKLLVHNENRIWYDWEDESTELIDRYGWTGWSTVGHIERHSVRHRYRFVLHMKPKIERRDSDLTCRWVVGYLVRLVKIEDVSLHVPFP